MTGRGLVLAALLAMLLAVPFAAANEAPFTEELDVPVVE